MKWVYLILLLLTDKKKLSFYVFLFNCLLGIKEALRCITLKGHALPAQKTGFINISFFYRQEKISKYGPLPEWSNPYTSS